MEQITGQITEQKAVVANLAQGFADAEAALARAKKDLAAAADRLAELIDSRRRADAFALLSVQIPGLYQGRVFDAKLSGALVRIEVGEILKVEVPPKGISGHGGGIANPTFACSIEGDPAIITIAKKFVRVQKMDANPDFVGIVADRDDFLAAIARGTES